jgi:hypothetical protein
VDVFLIVVVQAAFAIAVAWGFSRLHAKGSKAGIAVAATLVSGAGAFVIGLAGVYAAAMWAEPTGADGCGNYILGYFFYAIVGTIMAVPLGLAASLGFMSNDAEA